MLRNLFLEWTEAGRCLVAKDPIIQNSRWYIRPADDRIWKYELLFVENEYSKLVCTSESKDFLRWQAVTEILRRVTVRGYACPHLTKQSEVLAIKDFLYRITYDKKIYCHQETRATIPTDRAGNTDTTSIVRV